jgi:hypothetical protein
MNEATALQPVSPPTAAPQPADAEVEDSLRQQLLQESDAMARYAFSAGLPMSPEVLKSLSSLEEQQKEQGAAAISLADIGAIHAQLAVVVAPSQPRTIYLLQRDRARTGWVSILGPLPTVRRLMVAALLFTLLFVASSLTRHINVVTMGLDVYRMHGWILLNVLLFLMSAAGMGAAFNALFTAHSCIANGTYDPRLESSFWSQISLGVIAGLVISQIVPLGQESLQLPDLPENYDVDQILVTLKGAEGKVTGSLISKPVLALVGGFSSTMVYTVLQRLVSTLESLFKGNGADNRAEREQMVREIVAQKFGSSGMPGPTPKVLTFPPQTQASSEKNELKE